MILNQHICTQPAVTSLRTSEHDSTILKYVMKSSPKKLSLFGFYKLADWLFVIGAKVALLWHPSIHLFPLPRGVNPAMTSVKC